MTRQQLGSGSGAKPRLALVLSAAFLLAVSAALFAPALFGGKMLWGGDIETLALPFNLSARKSLAQGELPFWMPELYGGMPGIAATNLVFLYPSELLIHALNIPVPRGFALDAALQVFLAGWGMLLFCRRLGASLQAGLMAALFFALSGSQISILFAGHINNIKAIAMIPWAFWAADWALEEGSLLAWSLCGLALGLQILGIGMQIYAYTVPSLAAYALWKARAGSRQSWKFHALGFSAALFASILISAPQLFLSLQYKPFSWREGFSYEAFTSWSFHPKESIGWIVPGFYGWRSPTYHGDWPLCLSSEYLGLLPWALAAAGVAAFWNERARPLRFFAYFALASFLIGIGKWTPLHQIFYRLPLYSGFRTWTRFLCLMTFALCAASAFGWDALWQQARSARARQGALAFCALALLVSAACLSAGQGGLSAEAASLASSSALRALGLAAALGVLILLLQRMGLAALALLLLGGFHLFDQSELARRYLEFRDSAALTAMPPELAALPAQGTEPWRIFEAGGVWMQNASMIHGLEGVEGYHGVMMSGPLKLRQAMQARPLDWISLMNARYVLSRQELKGLPLLREGAFKIYSNPVALPRAWLVAGSRRAADDDAAFALMADPAFHPRDEAVLLEDAGLPGGKAQGQVRWASRLSHSFELDVDAGQASLLLISQNWYPSWIAEVDGRPERLLKADGTLCALKLAPGSHRVRLHYSSGLFAAGCLACLAALLGIGALAALRHRGAAWA